MTVLAGPAPVTATQPRRSLRDAISGNPLMAGGVAAVVVLMILAVIAPLMPYEPEAIDPAHALLSPSKPHWFGTDQVGRDVLTRVVYGVRTSLLIAAVVLALAAAVGVPLGIVAGYFGGWIDDVIMRVTDIFLAFPALLLALALASVLQPSAPVAALVIAATWWPGYTRLVRGQAASIAGRGYVESGRALGVGHTRMIFRHVLPNASTAAIVQVSLDVGGVVLTAAALSYLGLGAQDPTPEWGLMVSQGQSFFTTAWWLVTFPGLAILLAALAFNLLGDGLRTWLDPRRTPR
jgi:peptide/nickel transport system permease protein